jgi:hypothetical protein
MLGYNIFDPTEVVPEFTADFGSKRREKVDYALVLDGKPVVLIEAKKHGFVLRVEQEAQLFRYFSATDTRFAILTDGIFYRFYSDLDESGKMDQRPFFEFNMLDFTDLHVEQLKQFHKENFDPAETVEAARELKYTNEIKHSLSEEMRNPSDDFVRFILTRIEYPGQKTRQRIEQFTPIVQTAFSQFVKDLIDARLKSALERGNEATDEPILEEATKEHPADVRYPLELVLNSRGIEARARYEGGKTFVVLSGSQAAKDETPSLPELYASMRKSRLDDGSLVDQGSTYRLNSDQTFRSSSAAASFLLGASRNGYTEWKDAQGQTLRDLLES